MDMLETENQRKPTSTESEPLLDKKASPWPCWKKVLLVVGILLLIGCLFLLWRQFFDFSDLYDKFIKYIETLKENNVKNILITACFVILSNFAFLPGLSFFVIISSYYIGHFWPAALRFLLIFWPIKIIGFLVIKNCCYKAVHKKLKDNDYYNAICVESRKNGWAASFMMCFIWIMSSLKMYLVSLLSISFWQYLPCMLAAETMYVSLFALIGIEIHDLNAFLNGSFSSMTRAQKISYIMTLCFSIMTICLLAIGIYIIFRRVNQIKQIHQKEKAAAKKLGRSPTVDEKRLIMDDEEQELEKEYELEKSRDIDDL